MTVDHDPLPPEYSQVLVDTHKEEGRLLCICYENLIQRLPSELSLVQHLAANCISISNTVLAVTPTLNRECNLQQQPCLRTTPPG